MPAKRHSLEDIVKEIVANEPTWGPERVRRQMEDVALTSGHNPELLPSVATIGRIKQRMTPNEKAAYEYVRWPETFRAGVLPWESAPAVGELLRFCFSPGEYPRPRPQVQLARWFWRVRQVAPGMEIEGALRVSAHLVLSERELVDATALSEIEAYVLGFGPTPEIKFTPTEAQMRAVAPLLEAGGFSVAPYWFKTGQGEDIG